MRAHFSKQYTQQWYTDAKAHHLDEIIPATCGCCEGCEAETMILHILRCSNRNEVHTEHNRDFERRMREIEAPTHLLHLFEAGIELALLDGDMHSGEEWNSNPNVSRTEKTISKLLNDNRIPQHYKTVFQQQRKVGWEHLFMGKMASADGDNVGQTKNTGARASRTHIWMEWGRACWSHRNSILYGERKDKYKSTRIRLKAEAQIWMEALSIETLIPIQ